MKINNELAECNTCKGEYLLFPWSNEEQCSQCLDNELQEMYRFNRDNDFFSS